MSDYDPSTDEGYLRLLISDTHEGEGQIFSDLEIEQAISREGSVKLAAATLIEIIADNEALLLKAIRTQDLSTDGPKVSAELRKRAASLREQAAVDQETGTGVEDFAIVPNPSRHRWPYAELERVKLGDGPLW